MAFFTLPIRVLIQVNSSLVTLCGPPPVTILIWLHPAAVTAEKQGNPSEMTVLPGCKCCFAQREISVSRKPLTTFMFIAIGWPSLFNETAATNGTLLAEPRPLLPPRRSPPQYTSSNWMVPFKGWPSSHSFMHDLVFHAPSRIV